MNPSLNQDHRSILINIHKIYFADGFVLSSGVMLPMVEFTICTQPCASRVISLACLD